MAAALTGWRCSSARYCRWSNIVIAPRLQFGCIQMAASITESHDHRRQTLPRRVTLGAFSQIVAFYLTPRGIKNGL